MYGAHTATMSFARDRKEVDRVPVIVAWLKKALADVPLPEVGIVCGSGLGHLAETLKDPRSFKYEDIPLFPRSTVLGHKSELVYGQLQGKPVLLMRGRFHYYEGYSPIEVAAPIRAMAALGVRVLVVTNAAGGVDPSFNIGDIMVMDDHVFLPGVAGFNPLVGPNDDRFGPRFPPMSQQFARPLQRLVRDTAERLGFSDKMRYNGVYCNVSGPSYETRHEIKFLRMLGGQAVGMSTIQEVVVAVHAGMRVLGLSVITNKCLGPDDTTVPPSHQEVLDSAKEAEPRMQALVQHVVKEMDTSDMPEPQAFKYFKEHPMSDAQLAKAGKVGSEDDGKILGMSPVGAAVHGIGLALLVAGTVALVHLARK